MCKGPRSWQAKNASQEAYTSAGNFSLPAWESMVPSAPLPLQQSTMGPPTETAPEGLYSLLKLCERAVVQTITGARAPSIKLLYTNR